MHVESRKSWKAKSLFIKKICHILPRFGFLCQSEGKNKRHDMLGKSGQITAKHSILGGTSNMIKILFVCHGRIRTFF